jgi:hypothetical protein
MNNLPNENSPANAIPVGHPGDPFASTFPGALPTSAPDAFICPTRAELHAHWPAGVKNFAPMTEWLALCHWLDRSPMQPQLN